MKTANISVAEEGIQALYTARYAALMGDPIPDNALGAFIALTTPLIGPPPASLWPRGSGPVEPVGQPIPPSIYTETKFMYAGNDFPIVGRRFTRAEFVAYLKGLPDKHMTWSPQFTALHHTSNPNLAIRPKGFEVRDGMNHMANMRSGYRNTNHWNSGPHIFSDDNGIWIFSPLTKPGTHSPSFNPIAFAIETLGDYDVADDPKSGRGLACWENTCFAAAALRLRFGLGMEKFHGEDPRTTHRQCPGTKMKKSEVLSKIDAFVKVIGGIEHT